METLNILGQTSEATELPFKMEYSPTEGTHKAVQEWVMSFLTTKGTVAVVPAYGTDFITFLASGAIRGSSDVHKYFNKASNQALDDIDFLNRDGEVVVIKAVLVNYGIIESELSRILTLDVAFALSDGSTTRANLGVD